MTTNISQAFTSEMTLAGDSATSSEVLVENSNRAGLSITNLSSAIMYVLLSDGTASATNHTVALAQGDYYESPFNYTGPVNAVWASDAGGTAAITEFLNG